MTMFKPKLSLGFIAIFVYLSFVVMTPLFFKENTTEWFTKLMIYGLLLALSIAVPNIRSKLFNQPLFPNLLWSGLFYIIFLIVFSAIKLISQQAMNMPQWNVLLFNFFVVAVFEESFRNEFLVRHVGDVWSCVLFAFLHYLAYAGNLVTTFIMLGVYYLFNFIFKRFGLAQSIGAHAGYNHAIMYG